MSDKGRLFLYDDSFLSPPEFNNESENIICFYRMKNFFMFKIQNQPAFIRISVCAKRVSNPLYVKMRIAGKFSFGLTFIIIFDIESPAVLQR